jgi:ABC-2 type transport system ATP-binding protein
VIVIDNISKSFKSFKAVDNLKLLIEANTYVALLGPNGAGKTTLVEMIEGLQEPDKGSIIIDGKKWSTNASVLRNMIGISLQETKFTDKMTVKETLDLFGSFYKLGKHRTQEILQVINLKEKEHSFVVNLSGGQRQRLALGIAILNNPQILLLDEPTTGLDPNARREIWDILMQLKKEKGTTMILTTHYMEEAAYLCDRIVILDQGKILADGTLNELLNTYAPGEMIFFEIDKKLNTQALLSLKGSIEVKWLEEGTKGILTVNAITETVPQLIDLFEHRQIAIISFECRKKTLDDLFIAMTGRSLNE